ncbi:Histidine-containing phosphotransfer protein 4 [Morella rubra]|uniref:Histidine-containing phosphotransfer protein n=1 Tax=Morella rubra TaxID=262757 RepID=A0A6A1VW62_9ROSI|nr:Histidine-containing phosphotransfer protein 4 [Morella rubra]
MDIDELRRRIDTMRQSMLLEGILDRVFVQLERDEEKDTPNFVELIFEFYFEGSAEMIPAIEQELEAEAPDLDYVKLDEALFRFKGSSASVGANIVVTEIKKALRCCMKHDVEGNYKRLRKTLRLLKMQKILKWFMSLQQFWSSAAKRFVAEDQIFVAKTFQLRFIFVTISRFTHALWIQQLLIEHADVGLLLAG